MSATDDDRPSREIAYRLFATEFDDADFSYSESDEERAPNYVVTPTGARVNRLFVVGVLTEVERVNDDTLRGRVVDPTGAFVTYAGQYQPDAMAFLDRASPPAFAALTGKARTFQPEDSDRVFTSVRPESLSRVDASTRDRWTVATAEATLRRVGVMAAALDSGLRGDELQATLEERGIDRGLSAGVPLAIDRYGTTPGYLDALRRIAVEALEVVADERDSVGALDLAPDDPGGDVDLPALAALYDWEGDEPELGGERDADAASNPPQSIDSEPLTADTSGASTTDSGGATTPSEPTEPAATATEPAEPSASEEPDASATETTETTETGDDDSLDDSLGDSLGDSPDDDVDTGSSDVADDVDDGSDDVDGSEGADDGSEGADDGSEGADDAGGLGDFEDTGEADDTGEPGATAGSDGLGDFEDTSDAAAVEPTSESTADSDDTEPETDADVGMYELDEQERAEIESEYGAEFETGSEVGPAGEADIEVPSADELEEMAEGAVGGDTGETDDTETTGASVADESEPSAEPGSDDGAAGAADVDLEDAAVAAMADLDDGGGASREAVVARVVDEYGVEPGDVEDAIQSALMSGQCYEPTEDSLKAI